MSDGPAVLFCFECRRVRPKADMAPVSQNKKRPACSDCRARIDRCRELAKARRKGAA